jgi:hypothetical protein
MLGQKFVCSEGCRNKKEKTVILYVRKANIINNQNLKQKLLHNTCYQGVKVPLIVIGTITISEYRKKRNKKRARKAGSKN